ncbi:hypothetical protein CC80DRAFT_584785 [Byssothecium circinans]|uniref:Uncharacterized protein n=1 Tax=Byssothecium circinans TaxID=147558 RepID=A0A6A5U511_9PLEO|nr:hypothetical protein CC80DRAFT_584785 [Byssothecium circinans]
MNEAEEAELDEHRRRSSTPGPSRLPVQKQPQIQHKSPPKVPQDAKQKVACSGKDPEQENMSSKKSGKRKAVETPDDSDAGSDSSQSESGELDTGKPQKAERERHKAEDYEDWKQKVNSPEKNSGVEATKGHQKIQLPSDAPDDAFISDTVPPAWVCHREDLHSSKATHINPGDYTSCRVNECRKERRKISEVLSYSLPLTNRQSRRANNGNAKSNKRKGDAEDKGEKTAPTPRKEARISQKAEESGDAVIDQARFDQIVQLSQLSSSFIVPPPGYEEAQRKKEEAKKKRKATLAQKAMDQASRK